MRYYVTVNGSDVTWLSERAGNSLRQHAVANLRSLRISTGFDYQGLGVQGESVNQVNGLDVLGIERRIRAQTPATADNKIGNTRVVISQTPIPDSGAATTFELLLAIHEGPKFAWLPGTANYAGMVTIDKENRSSKVNAVVQDIFQDVMISNCASIQAVLTKYLAVGHSERMFYGKKATFAQQWKPEGLRKTIFDTHDPDQYASFSSMARSDLFRTMDTEEETRLARLWSSFLIQNFTDYLLTADEAVHLVRTGYFHDAKQERIANQGQQPVARKRREYLSADELSSILNDQQIVSAPGSYILCIINRDPGKLVDRLGPAFNWRNSNRSTPRKIKLCTEESYAGMVEYVRTGVVTPIRLFLQAQC